MVKAEVYLGIFLSTRNYVLHLAGAYVVAILIGFILYGSGKINMKDIVRLMVLFLLSNTLHKLIVSGIIIYYINPRFLPLTKAALVFIIILGVLSLLDLLVAVLKGKVSGSLHQTPILLLLAFSTTLVFIPQTF